MSHRTLLFGKCDEPHPRLSQGKDMAVRLNVQEMHLDALKHDLQRDGDGNRSPDHHIEEAAQHLAMVALTTQTESITEQVTRQQKQA
jgi:hypothetical protein